MRAWKSSIESVRKHFSDSFRRLKIASKQQLSSLRQQLWLIFGGLEIHTHGVCETECVFNNSPILHNSIQIPIFPLGKFYSRAGKKSCIMSNEIKLMLWNEMSWAASWAAQERKKYFVDAFRKRYDHCAIFFELSQKAQFIKIYSVFFPRHSILWMCAQVNVSLPFAVCRSREYFKEYFSLLRTFD